MAATPSACRVPTVNRIGSPCRLWLIAAARVGERRPHRRTMEHPSAMGARMSRPEDQWRPPEPPNRPPRPGGPEARMARPARRPGRGGCRGSSSAVLVTLVLVWQAAPGGGSSQAELDYSRFLELVEQDHVDADQLRELERQDHRRVHGRLRGRRQERVHDPGPARRSPRPGRRHCSPRTTSAATTSPHRRTGSARSSSTCCRSCCSSGSSSG